VAPKTDGGASQPASFQGKLSHTSPVQTASKKITVYFSSTTIKEEDKVMALHKVFGRSKVPGSSPVIVEKPPTPHKIQMKLEEVLQIEEGSLGEAGEPKVRAMKAKRKLNINQSLNQDTSTVVATGPAVGAGCRKLTEFFAVRRSVRKPKTAILEEKQRNLEEAVLTGREDGLTVHNFAGKGRGVVTTRLFRKGEFVVEYAGDLIDMTEARIRERLYAADQNTGCYMYYFQHKNQSYCVDATSESRRLGRLVNHSRSQGNLIPKVVEVEDRPHLLLVARVDIAPGDELLYDYGDRSRVSLKYHPWLAT